MKPERLEHIRRVAALADHWADRLAVSPMERRRWLRAVWLHDALRDALPADLARWAGDTAGPPELRHGPASAARAQVDGEGDTGVLDAVRYHSVGFAGWDMAGRILYCADYLEPGRPFDRERRADLARQLPSDPDAVLREVARSRLLHLIQSGWPVPDLTYHFWNSLVATGGSSR